MKSFLLLGLLIGYSLCMPMDLVEVKQEEVVQVAQQAIKEEHKVDDVITNEVNEPVVAVKKVVVNEDAHPEKKDQCGLISNPGLSLVKRNIRRVMRMAKKQQANTPQCQLCLDLLDIAKTYEECGEAEVEHQMENECDKEFHEGTAGDKGCRGLVDSLMDDVIDETDHQDAEATCTKKLGQDCKYP